MNGRNPIKIIFSRLRWYLTLTYNLATLAAIFLLGWWGLLAGVFYLQHQNPGMSWLEIVGEQVFPALKVIVPSMLILVIPATLISAYFGFLNARWLELRLNRLRKALQGWKAGDFSVKAEDDTQDEIGAFAKELNGMALDFERLLQSRRELAALEERNHLASDLHDSVKQQITAAAFQIGTAKALLDSNPAAASKCLEEAENLNHAAHQELNAIIFELRPAGLPGESLAQGLSEYAGRWAEQNKVKLHLQVQEAWNPEGRTKEELFRFVQEALANVARHSRATEVALSLAMRKERTEVELSIGDNGCGFDIGNVHKNGFGLTSMRSRIEQLGGRFVLESRPGAGTHVGARFPLKEVK